MFRTVSDAAEVRRAIAPLERRVAIEHVLEVPPVRLRTVAGLRRRRCFPTRPTFRSCARWGEPLLFGPGSIHVAHTADEFVSIAELSAAADHYVTLARALLADSCSCWLLAAFARLRPCTCTLCPSACTCVA